MPIITCDNKEIGISYDNTTSSEYIKDIVKLSDNVDVVIPIPDKYYTVINNYIDYLKGLETFITNTERLFLCFQLSTLFDDDDYFKYCVQQTFNNWSYMCNMVYNEFNDDLQWSFFVLAPYDFIPEHLINNNLFITQWNQHNQNVVIKVNNNNETYYNNVTSINKNDHQTIKTFHTVEVLDQGTNHTKEIGRKKETIYYKSNNIMVEGYYNNNKKTGLWIWWYNNDQNTLKFKEHYVDDKLDGTRRRWYDDKNQTTDSLRHIEDGLRHTEGNLWYEEQYVNGKADGLWKRWNNDKDHTLYNEGHYVEGERGGEWRYWYDNDQHTLAYEGSYTDGKRDGKWRYYDNQGHITFDGEYINDVKQH